MQDQGNAPRLLQSPSLVSDAVRRLGLAATDRMLKPLDPRRPEDGDNILRIMTNLLTVSQHKHRRESESKPAGETPKNYAPIPTRRSMVFLSNTTTFAGPDRKVAVDYIFESTSLAEVCERNAVLAQQHGRYDHERVFRILRSLFQTPQQCGGTGAEVLWASCAPNTLVYQVVSRL